MVAAEPSLTGSGDRSLSRACVRMTKLPLGGPETPRRRRVRLVVLGTDLGTKRGATAEMGETRRDGWGGRLIVTCADETDEAT